MEPEEHLTREITFVCQGHILCAFFLEQLRDAQVEEQRIDVLSKVDYLFNRNTQVSILNKEQ